MPNAKTWIALAIVWAMATPTWAGEDEPFPLAISSVTPSFRASPLGPEFLVSFVNTGSEPIRIAALAKTVFIEMGGVRYDRGAILSHDLPPEIAPGAEGQESVIVGQFGVPLRPGTNTVTILIGGVRSSPVRFIWSPERPHDRDASKSVSQDYDRGPVPIHITQPRYPPAAFNKGISGTVEVEILIDNSGRVAKARIVRSIPELDAAALECVRDWTFRPAQKAGEPVATVASAPVTFKILDKKK
jgi:protein TonB